MIWWGPAGSIDESHEALESLVARGQAAPAGCGAYAMIDRQTSACVGNASLLPSRAIPDAMEIAFEVSVEHQGRGFATEAAGALTVRAFVDMHLKDVMALIIPANTPSRRVVEGLGFAIEGSVTFANYLHDVWVLRPEPRMPRRALGDEA